MVTKTDNHSSSSRVSRAPIVVVVGHVNHGKTTLLDTLRKTNIAAKESGSITQHIGAWEVEHNGKRITFIDTPGHEAFSKMRQRGAHLADLAVLVVAADEGVRPQTTEAIEALKVANTPFLVAINKIDLPSAQPDKVKKELTEKGVVVEEWGGKVPAVAISAKTGEHLSDLLDMMLLMGEIEELTVDPTLPAEGTVVEAHLDKQRGITASLVLHDGHVRKGDFVVAKQSIASTKIMEDFRGSPIIEVVAPSPVRIAGFNILPEVGAPFCAFRNRAEAEEAVLRAKKLNVMPTTKESPVVSEEQIILPLFLKADTVGSLEALEDALLKLQIPSVTPRIVGKDIGDIGEDDMRFIAMVPDVAVVGFRVRMQASRPAAGVEKKETPIGMFEVIYEAVDWVAKLLRERIPARMRRTDHGSLVILRYFRRTGAAQIVGGKVLEGFVREGDFCEVSKENTMQVFTERSAIEGKVTNVERNKVKVEEIRRGEEAGLAIEIKTTLRAGNVLQFFEKQKEEVHE